MSSSPFPPSHLPALSLTPTFLPWNYSLYCSVLSAGSPSLARCLFYSNYYATGYTVAEPINFCSWINCLTAVVYAHKHTHPHAQSASPDQSQLRLPGSTVTACAHACQSESAEYLRGPACVTVCVHVCVCARGYAGWSRGPVRQGQMVPGGWLSSWWPSWWCCLWSLLIRYASLPESPAPSHRCLSFCLSHRSQFMSVCLPLTPLCISNTHTIPPCLRVCALTSTHIHILYVYEYSPNPQPSKCWPEKNLQAVTSHTLCSNRMEPSLPAPSVSILVCHHSDLPPTPSSHFRMGSELQTYWVCFLSCCPSAIKTTLGQWCHLSGWSQYLF